ncbi:MAG: MBL fold metallo-hydrolase [Bacillota bacterium]|jgi:phosphoribosyl 1,2-cyclic phosphodiesterase
MEFTTLMSGSAGNCTYISGGNTKILVDVGCSCRYLEKALSQIGVNLSDIDAIFISHEHTDHIRGVPVSSSRYNIPVFASDLTWGSLPFYEDFLPWQRHHFEYDMQIGDLSIDFFKTSHDAIQPVGMIFRHREKKVGLATDTGQVSPTMIKFLTGCDGLILEANHSSDMLAFGPYPYFLKKRIAGPKGHLSNKQSALALSKIVTQKTRSVLLAHLSEINNNEVTALTEIKQMLSHLKFACHCSITAAKNRTVSPLIKLA